MIEGQVQPVIPKIDKWKLFEMVDYKVYHPVVRDFHDSDAKIKVAVAPRRTTKSYASAHDVLPECLIPEARVWVVGPSYGLAEKEFRYIHEALVIKGGKFGLPKPKICRTNAKSGQLYIQFAWGAVVEGKSADRPDSLLGEAVDAVIYSESAELPRHIRERYVSPTLNTKQGREIIPTTPQARAEWVHELWDIGLNGGFDEIESFQWDRKANPLYDEKEFKRAKKFYGEDSPIFREQYLGEWVYYAGLVFNKYNHNLHVIKPFAIPKSWRVVRAIDFGHRDPFVCLWGAIGPHNEIYIFQEYYNREGPSIREHAVEIKSRSKGYRLGETVGDPASRQSIEDLSFEGIGCNSANHDREAGRLRVQEYLSPTEDGPAPFNLKHPKNQKWPRLYFFDNCIETIRELKFYRWKEGRAIEKDTEKTEGEDHAMDALRYLCMTRPSPFHVKTQLPTGSFSAIMSSIKRNRALSAFIR